MFLVSISWSGKNHTWIVTEALRPLIVNVNFTKGGRVQFKAVSFAGYVGVLTGMKQVGDAGGWSVESRRYAEGRSSSV